jgi:iron complex outermembrane receptor protein
MKLRHSILTVTVSLAAALPCAAQESASHQTEPVVVTARRIGTAPSAGNRSVTVLTRDDIESAPVHSLDELLGYVTGLDLRSRGARGVQADASIRGSSFEQVLILVDGVRVSDPQTGHHNLDIPVTLADIEQVEILKGQGSSLYGPNAMGGIIHIRTRRVRRDTRSLSLGGGSFGYAEGSAAAGFSILEADARLSAEARRSDGHRRNTDFDIYTFALSSSVPVSGGEGALSLGFTSKDFGANSFYSSLFPLQRERTKTLFLRAGAETGAGDLAVAPRFWWRRHEDRFLLDFTMPQLLDNRHETDSYGSEIEVSMDSSFGVTTAALEIAEETIDSSNLGDHRRRRAGAAFEHVVAFGGGSDARLGGSLYYFSGQDWQFWPGFDAGWQVSPAVRLFTSVEKSFRVPTYTELYYVSPANVGNPDLEAEEAWAFEAGGRTAFGGFTGEAALFVRDATNLIDWVRPDESSPWSAVNTGRVTTRGVEASLSWKPDVTDSFFSSAGAAWTFLDSNIEEGELESRYVLDHLRHQVVLDFVDVRILRRAGPFELYVEATDIFDEGGEDFPGVDLPGRWVGAGVRFGTRP